MNRTRRLIAGAVIAGSALTGGMIGAAVASGAAASTVLAANGSNSTVQTAASNNSSGKFVPNEDPNHEKNESAAREAQENAGQFPTVP